MAASLSPGRKDNLGVVTCAPNALEVQGEAGDQTCSRNFR